MNDCIIETAGLTKIYGSQKSVSDLNIHVRLGRNGAGKTTTMKMLLGLTAPSSGELHIFGEDIRTAAKEILPRVGSLIESPGFYPNLTGTENLKIFAELRGVKRRSAIQNALDLVGLPYRDKKLYAQYSLGMKQRLAIALAVMHDPELLILDEPINGQGKTILISSHILSEIALLADDIGIIDKGRLLEEESLEELEAKNGKYIRFILSDANRASNLLAYQFKARDCQIEDEYTLILMDASLPMPEIIRCFVEHGIAVSDAHLCEDTLEDYFKRVTGGVGIA